MSEPTGEICFVIQPFDGGTFDKRFKDVFAPAIKKVGLRPYRVDQDPGSIVPIETIEHEISNAAVCLADVTLDNPNVWYELGFAIACRKPVCIICSKERTTQFPFDIRHRSILHYNFGSPSDFAELGARITEKINALLKLEQVSDRVAQLKPTGMTSGLRPHEVAALALIVGCIEDDGMRAQELQRGMRGAGFTEAAAGVAIASLLRRGFVKLDWNLHQDFPEEPWKEFVLTDDGKDWLVENQEELDLVSPPRVVSDDDPF